MHRITLIILILLLSHISMAATPPKCKNLANSEVGQIKTKLVDEASGMAYSPDGKQLFLINDSGGGPFFYVLQPNGKKIKKVRIKGYKERDPEALSFGPCGKHKCLFFADIGDNLKSRDFITIVAIKYRDVWNSKVHPYKIIKMQYPDGAHNAEAFAVHPNGDFIIATKEQNRKITQPTELFKVNAAYVWSNSTKQKPLTLERIGSIPMPTLSLYKGEYDNLVTGMDISSNGKFFILITYKDAYEFYWDIANEKAPLNFSHENYKAIKLKHLYQQECISYLESDLSFTYSTEIAMFPRPKHVPIIKVNCR